jgi:hypothetical protein
MRATDWLLVGAAASACGLAIGLSVALGSWRPILG